MKKLTASIALAIAFTLPIMESAKAAELYVVARNNTEIWDHSFERGNLRCTVQIGDEVERSWCGNWPRWIYVNASFGGNDPYRRFCHGWVDKRNLEKLAITYQGIREQKQRLLELNETAFGY